VGQNFYSLGSEAGTDSLEMQGRYLESGVHSRRSFTRGERWAEPGGVTFGRGSGEWRHPTQRTVLIPL